MLSFPTFTFFSQKRVGRGPVFKETGLIGNNSQRTHEEVLVRHRFHVDEIEEDQMEPPIRHSHIFLNGKILRLIFSIKNFLKQLP